MQNHPAQRQQCDLAALVDASPAMVAQRQRLSIIEGSPRLAAQRATLNQVAGAAQGQGVRQRAGAGFFADEPAETRQITTAAFLDRLRDVLKSLADQELAVIGQTSDHCPYIAKWFAFYAEQDAQHIEKAILRYAPEAAGAADLDGYIQAVGDRVRQGLKQNIDSGAVDGVPVELMAEKPEPSDFLHMAQESDGDTVQRACLKGGGGGGGGGGGHVAVPLHVPVLLPPPANAAIAPGGQRYARARPNFGAAGGTFSGFDLFTMAHVPDGDFDVSSFEVGPEVGFWWIINQATTPLGGATDLAIWHLCRFSAVANFEVTSIVNQNLDAFLQATYLMVPHGATGLRTTRANALAIAIGRLNTAGWVLP